MRARSHAFRAEEGEFLDLGSGRRKRFDFRAVRQRVIAEMLETAAARAEGEGRTREANELREQAACAREVAAAALRGAL
jgi:hypothetical protein